MTDLPQCTVVCYNLIAEPWRFAQGKEHAWYFIRFIITSLNGSVTLASSFQSLVLHTLRLLSSDWNTSRKNIKLQQLTYLTATVYSCIYIYICIYMYIQLQQLTAVFISHYHCLQLYLYHTTTVYSYIHITLQQFTAVFISHYRYNSLQL